MLNPKNIQRYCFLDPEGSPLSININVPEQVVAGGEFRIYDPDIPEPVLKWRMGAENGGSKSQTIKYNVKKLNKHILTCHLLACGIDPELTEALIEITLHQGSKKCRLSSPAEKKVENIPPCKLNNPFYFRLILVFINFNQETRIDF